jgi:hypothetical protein
MQMTPCTKSGTITFVKSENPKDIVRFGVIGPENCGLLGSKRIVVGMVLLES